MPHVDVNRAKAQLDELVEQAARGEEVIITRGDGTAPELVPVLEGEPRPRFGSAKDEVWVSDDFDEPLSDFDGYMPAS